MSKKRRRDPGKAEVDWIHQSAVDLHYTVKNREALLERYRDRLEMMGRGSRLTDKALLEPGVLEMAVAVDCMDDADDDSRLVRIFLKLDLPEDVRGILVDWLERRNQDRVPWHQLSPGEVKAKEQKKKTGTAYRAEAQARLHRRRLRFL